MEEKVKSGKKSVAVKCIVWILSVALIVFYLTVFYLGFNRKSCLEYEMVYYRDIYFENWPGAGGINYETGTKEKRTEEKFVNRRGGGWNTRVGDEMWTSENDAYMMYHITDETAGELTLDMYVEALAAEDINAAVYVNDQKVIDQLSVGHNKGTFSYDPSVDVYTVVISSDKVYEVDTKGNIIADETAGITGSDVLELKETTEVVQDADEESEEPLFRGVKIYSITIDRKG